ncbi:MAG: alkaline shock response membrane anchor protein AmaP [Chloroflexi bacterium]|nr:alkaline shock response membrane anchor protein AmaP [Chloroflexota bacterium]
MQRLNSILAVVLALLLIGGSIAVTIFAFTLPGPYLITAYNGLEFRFSPLTTSDKLLAAVFCLIASIIGFFLLALEFLGPPRSYRLMLPTDETTHAWTPAPDTEAYLECLLGELEGVSRAHIAITATHTSKQLDVHAAIAVYPRASMPTLVEQSKQRIKQVVEQELGLTVGAVDFTVTHQQRAPQ